MGAGGVPIGDLGHGKSEPNADLRRGPAHLGRTPAGERRPRQVITEPFANPELHLTTRRVLVCMIWGSPPNLYSVLNSLGLTLCYRSFHQAHTDLPMRIFRAPSSVLSILVAVGLLAAGCSSLSNTEKGAAIGTGAGAAAGAAVGKAAGGTAEGAIIGAAIGGTAGAIIGQRMDKKAEELDEELENAEIERVGEGIKVTFDSGLLFDFDSAALRPAAERDLAEFANSMEEFDGTKILIVGHTDSKGSDSYNEELSERRSASASNYLKRQGVASSRLSMAGRGESEPMASNQTPEGRQQNRRVEVAIYASEEYRERVQEQSGDE